MSKNVSDSLKFLKKPAYLKASQAWRQLATWPISAYQNTLSFDHGPLKILYPDGYCRYYPSCSEYSKRAILKYGVLRGSAKGAWRILRCNPFSAGGVDEA